MGEGLLPKWRAGHVIRDVAGFFAAIFLINVILTTIVGTLFPSLEPGGIDLRSKAIGLVWALAIGAIWLALRSERLDLARIALAANALILAGASILMFLRTAMSSTSVGMLGGIIFYVINPVLIYLLWLAYREVGTEQERRHAG